MQEIHLQSEEIIMATYTFRDKKTGEIKDISMPMAEIVDFENNKIGRAHV